MIAKCRKRGLGLCTPGLYTAMLVVLTWAWTLGNESKVACHKQWRLSCLPIPLQASLVLELLSCDHHSGAAVNGKNWQKCLSALSWVEVANANGKGDESQGLQDQVSLEGWVWSVSLGACPCWGLLGQHACLEVISTLVLKPPWCLTTSKELGTCLGQKMPLAVAGLPYANTKLRRCHTSVKRKLKRGGRGHYDIQTLLLFCHNPCHAFTKQGASVPEQLISGSCFKLSLAIKFMLYIISLFP